jgi:hypothetical protein
MALAAASKETFASFRPKFERNCSFRLIFSSRFNSYSDSSPLRDSTAGSTIIEFITELLPSTVDFSCLTFFRCCGVGSNSKASDVEFSDEEAVTEEILVLRLDAIVVAA